VDCGTRVAGTTLNVTRAIPSRRRALLACVSAGLTILICAGLFGAAVLAHAPPLVVPLIAAVCLGGPVLAAFELRAALATLRGSRAADAPPLDARALVALRRHLDQLPEAQHPLGL